MNVFDLFNMASTISSHFCLLTVLLAFLVIPTISRGLLPENHVAFFIFGDSLVDVGNNNYLGKDAPHADFPPYGETFIPYGKTFLPNPTGRFCDGRIVPDFIAECVNLPLIPPYLQPDFDNYINGANFASAGACVLNQTDLTTINLNKQLGYFKIVAKKLTEQLGEDDAQELLSNAVYYFSIGGNDMFNLMAEINSSGLTTSYELEYMLMMLGNLTTVIKEVYNNGGRKFGIQNVGPLGCTPRAKLLYGLETNLTDNCVQKLQILVEHYNILVSEHLERLSTQLSDYKYSFLDYYAALMERVLDCSKFGFMVEDSACCGSGPYNGEMKTCGDFEEAYELCGNPYIYVWFDSGHPTERINMQLAKLFWNGNHSFTWPYNLSTLFKTSSSIQTL